MADVKKFDPFSFISDMNCMFFGACSKKQIDEEDEEDEE